MAGTITRTAAIAVSLGLLSGLATTALAEQKKRPPIKLTPKSCTWVQTGQVVASGKTTKDTQDGTTWKCTNGSWSQVRTKGGAKK
jgi:hypothetical protein